MYEGKPSTFLAVIVQGMLLQDQEHSSAIEEIVSRFRKKSLPICAFGPNEFRQEGYLWGNGCSAECEIEGLLGELFMQDKWIHPFEVLLITNCPQIAMTALRIPIGAVLFLGKDGCLNEQLRGFLASEAEANCYDLLTLASKTSVDLPALVGV